MRTIQIQGLQKRCSQLVMGSDFFTLQNPDQVTELLDEFVRIGGNTIDTAYIYCRGESEQAIAKWLQLRDNRGDVIILDKGAHHDSHGPRVTPEYIAADLKESLKRLKSDYIDIYMLHRDDTNIPVEVIIDALNEHVAAGRILTFGVSNWSHRRIEEANNYASRQGIVGITSSSPNLSLAKPNEPRWHGCISADKEACDWYEEHQMPLLSWSSQAGGFFTGRYSPEITTDSEAVRVYYSDANWERLRRAQQLAAEKNTTPIQIALAYVLNQPFPTAALFGPRTIGEMHSSYEAFQIELTSKEIQWLDLQDTEAGIESAS